MSTIEGRPGAGVAETPTPPAPRLTDTMLSLVEIEELARQSLAPMAYDYVASGAADEITIRWNREAFDGIRLRPRVLRDAAVLDTRVTLLGDELPLPILLAPTAYQRVVHPEGEVATARGAGAAGAPFVVSTATTAPLEDITRVATAPLWFQLYVQSDREFTTRLVGAAEEAGCRALCLTVDNPVLGARNRQARSGFRLPAGALTPYLDDLNNGRRDLFTAERVSVTWKDVEWLRSLSSMPVLLKGILTGDDAGRAVEVGAAGVIVSNHGGRNLDTLPATIEALPEVVASVAGRLPVLLDGGIRRGTDVLKAVALGADAVLIGRPYLYGLAVGGAGGVQRVLEILRRELELAMTLCGRASLRELDRSVLWAPPAGYFE